MQEVTIFLDYDDVLVDWCTPACETFNLDLNNPEVRTQIEDNWGGIDKWVPDNILWETINQIGSSWWENLPLLPWARNLYERMSNLGRVVILTAPSPDPSCLAGKGASIKKLFNTRDFLIGKPKEVAARFDRILIDDRNSNCAKFVANGGQAFEWPNAVKLTRLGKENGESVWDAMINDAIDFVCQVKRNSSKNFYFHCIPELKIAEK